VHPGSHSPSRPVGTRFLRRLVRGAAVLALAGALGCGSEGGQPLLTRGSIQGWVYVPEVQRPRRPGTDGTGLLASPSAQPPSGYRPAIGATVTVSGSRVRNLTDEAGYYRLDDLIPTQHTVGISLTGYYPVSFVVRVLSGRVTTVGRDDGGTLLEPVERLWTVMVFLNADNDLETYGIEDVNEMEMVGSSGAVEIVVQMDRIPGYDDSNGNWTDCRRLRVVRDPAETSPQARTPLNPTLVSTDLERLGEVDMGDPQTLRDFVAWAQRTYPAQHYLLVVWNHGSGWLVRAPQARPENPASRAVSYDDTSQSFISTTDLPEALAAWFPLDVVAFDASLMQMAEVGYEIRGQASLMVGSEESPPGSGYPYQTFLRRLIEDPAMAPAQLAAHIVDDTVAFYGTTGATTQSCVGLGQMEPVRSALHFFAVSLQLATADHGAEIALARTQAQAYAYHENKDLYDFARLCAEQVNDPQVRERAEGMMSAVGAAVTAEAHGAARGGSHGLAIYLPHPAQYVSSYGTLALARDTVWDEWLQAGPD
jgi:hypothetical protein